MRLHMPTNKALRLFKVAAVQGVFADSLAQYGRQCQTVNVPQKQQGGAGKEGGRRRAKNTALRLFRVSLMNLLRCCWHKCSRLKFQEGRR